MFRAGVLGWILLPVWGAGCFAQRTAPVELGRIYAVDAEEAQDRLPTTLLVPGVLGSRVIDPESGQVYWGAVGGQSPRPAKDPDDLRALALPIDQDVPFAELHDGLVADAVLHVVAAETPFGDMQLRGYPGVLEGLASALLEGSRATRAGIGELRSGQTGVGTAPYDWRLDLVASARQLDAAVERASAARMEACGDPRVDLVGHSMGSLVVRWYLMYGTADLRPDGSPPKLTWAGARRVHNAVLVAPPSAGSPMVFESLVEGEKVSSFLPRYPQGLVGTFPSMYTMMPRARHGAVVYTDDRTAVDLLDPEVWARYGWGVLNPEADAQLEALLPDVTQREDRYAVAYAWLQRALARTRGVQAALDVDADPPEGLRLHLFAGDSRATPSLLGVDRATGELRWLGTAPGDGRVTRQSAIFDERVPGGEARRLQSPIPWTTVHMGGGEHFGIVRDPVFLDGLLYLLLQEPVEP
jgi:pimeloyl-ACP methyl ester carboxylesterase